MDVLIDAAVLMLVGVPVALVGWFGIAFARQAWRARRLPRTASGQPRPDERRNGQ